jgi:hypothetical protein
MAMSANGDWLDQFEEGNAPGGHAGEVEAVPYPAVTPPMTSGRFRPDAGSILLGDAHELPNELYRHDRGRERQGKRHTKSDHLLRYAFHDEPPLSCPALNSLGPGWLTGRYQQPCDGPGAGSGVVIHDD